jgi:type II secretory pathway component PulC
MSPNLNNNLTQFEMNKWISTFVLSLLLSSGATMIMMGNTASADEMENLEKPSRELGGIHSEVDRNVSVIDNGVVITITSDNPEVVEKIQERAENGKMHPRGHHQGERGEQLSPDAEEL